MRSLIDIQELSVKEIDELIKVADDIIAHPKKYAEACHGKKLATLSPLDAEELAAREKPRQEPPSSIIAASKLSLVLVEGSKNRVASSL